MRTDLLERETDILRWISENQSKAFIARELKCNPKTLNSLLKQLNIDYKGN
jgi:DNA-binding CsgD family transcriptional regulator